MDSTGSTTDNRTAADDGKHWFVLRDLKRPNALMPAYRELAAKGLRAGTDFFTPMTVRIVEHGAKRVREEQPFIHDLLFLHATRQEADLLLGRMPTLQYRFVRGAYMRPMVVDDRAMARFIRAVDDRETPRYYAPQEITEAMVGRRVRIVGGHLDGYEGRLLKCRGSRKRQLLVAIPGIIVAAVMVQPEFVEVIG